MKLIARTILILSTFLSIFFMGVTPAEARPARAPSTGIKIEVVETLNSSWDVRSAVSEIDWYTGSNWVMSNRCHAGTRCVRITKGKVGTTSFTTPVGWSHACNPTKEPCRITIDVDKAARNKLFTSATKRWLIRHELGHYRGLGHAKTCNSTMYEKNRCGTKVPPYTFTSAEQTHLRKV